MGKRQDAIRELMDKTGRSELKDRVPSEEILETEMALLDNILKIVKDLPDEMVVGIIFFLAKGQSLKQALDGVKNAGIMMRDLKLDD